MSLISRIYDRITGNPVVADNDDADFDNIINNGLVPTGIEDASANDTAWKSTTNPTVAPTNLLGEVKQLRYQVKAITGETDWVDTPNNTISAMEVDINALQDNTRSIRDSSRGLIIKTGTDTDHDIDIDADEIILYNTNNIPYNSINTSAVNLTVAIDASGVNGLDTGSPANTTWYYIWVIYDSTGGTLASLLSTSETFAGLTLPGDYDYGALVGCMYTNGSANFIASFYQLNNKVRCLTGSFTETAHGVYTTNDLSALIPPNAVHIHMTCTGTADTQIYIHPGNSGVGLSYNTAYSALSFGTIPEGTMDCVIETSQVLFGVTSSGGTTTFQVQGWEY